MRTREPVSTPAGILIFTCSVFGVTPLPLQSEHGVSAPAGAFAIRTGLRKLQTPAGSHHLSRAFASRAMHDRPAGVARTLAARTLLAAIDGDIGRQAGKCFFKTKCERDLDIAAFFRQRSRRLGLASAPLHRCRRKDRKKYRENSSRRRDPSSRVPKSKPEKSKPAAPPPLRTGARTERRIGIEIVVVISETVENLTLLLVRKNVVGFLNFFEFFLGGFIVRIHVRMKLARQTAVRFFDLVRLRVFFYAENVGNNLFSPSD